MVDDNYTFTIQGLLRKRAYVAGDIETTQKKLTELVAALENIDATILLFDGSYQAETITPKAFRPPADWAHRGEMSRIILSILRQASEPLTSRDIAVELMRERALDTNDLKMVRLMTKRCGVSLRHQRDRGFVRSEQGPGQYMVWQVAK